MLFYIVIFVIGSLERGGKVKRQTVATYWITIALISSIALGLWTFKAWCEDARKPHNAKLSEKLIVIAVEFNSHAACAHVAKSKGWYKEAGISIQAFDSYVTGMSLAAALTRGDVDAAYICLIPAICAYANGRVPLKVVAGTHQYGYAVVVNPEKISVPSDLEKPGMRIGCAREGSPTDVILHKAISIYGLNERKVLGNLRRMNPPKQLMALKMGYLDAAIMPEQYPSMAKKAGFQILLSAKELWPEMQGSVLIVTDRLIAQYPEIVRRLVKVTRQSTRWINAYPKMAADIVAGVLQAKGGRILPAKTAALTNKLDLSPETVLASLTDELVCTTTVDTFQVQQTINYLVELGYIAHNFDAGKILTLVQEES